MQSKKVVWVLEDDPGCQFVYRDILEVRYLLRLFDNLVEFKGALKTKVPDLIIADLRLKDGNFLNYLDGDESTACLTGPFIVVSSMDDLDVLRACFEEGAVDFLTKPFSPTELIVKLDRIFNARPGPLHLGNRLVIDPTSFSLKIGDRSVAQLTAKELQILSVLNQRRNECVSRKELIESVWQGVHVSSKTLDVHLFNLRRKLARVGMNVPFRHPNHYVLIDKSSGETP